MGGKFTNIVYHDTVDNLVQSMKDILNNPYYTWTDKPPTPVTYYNRNREMSTLDEGSKLEYDDIGKSSPTKYNKIENMYLYGMEQIQISLNNEEFGVESDSIDGECIILPNTIIPYPGDYFSISYLKEKRVLFRVTNTSFDTLENGSNIYKVNYKLEVLSDESDLKNNVKDTYVMAITNIGTGFNPIIRKESYLFIEKLDSIVVELKKYFKSIFYDRRVQTFIFKFLEARFYDPYLIEFFINNNLMDGDGEYIYVNHQLNLDNMFPIHYNRTFFRCLEEKDIKRVHKYRYKAIGTYIDDPLSSFSCRYEDYFEVNYELYNAQFTNGFACFDDDFVYNLEHHILFDNENSIYNIIIKYFYDDDITEDDINTLDYIDYCNNNTLFYAIPCVIFCLEQYIINRMKTE